MTLKNTYIALILLCLTSASSIFGGGLDKGFEALGKKDYYGAKKQFEKIVFKDPIGGHYGLSLVHFEKQNPFYDIDLSLRHCNSADSAYQFVLQKDMERLTEYGIDGASIKKLKKDIGLRAFDDLMVDPTEYAITLFLNKYRFSEKYPAVVAMRDEQAFAEARREDSYESYRQFIIDYPGALQRAEADSLYALRFFEQKTASRSVDGYIQFVKEFPANPFTDRAYDTIFNWIDKTGTFKAYQDFLIEFPENQHTNEAWKAINIIMLRNYSKNRLTEMITALTRNPYKELLEEELELIGQKRFVMSVDSQKVLIGIDGLAYGGGFDDIGDFKEGLAKVAQDGKSGYINKLGKIIIPLDYDDAYDFSQGLAVVEKNGKFGAVDRFGEIAIPFIYDGLGNSNFGYLSYEKGESSGFIDWRGRLQFDRTFEYASDFSDGSAVIRVDGLYGAIDTAGKYTIPALYDWVEDRIGDRSRVKKEELFGVYQHAHQLVIPIKYEGLGTIGDGHYAFASEELLGYVDEYGDTLVSPSYDLSPNNLREHLFTNGYARVKKNGKWGLIDSQGKPAIPLKYDELDYNGYSILSYRSKNKWGYVRIDGEELPGQFDSVKPFEQGVAVVYTAGLAGMINTIGDIVIAPEFEDLDPIKDTELVVFTEDGYEGLMTRSGERVLEPEYDAIEALNIRFAKLTRDGDDQLYDLTESIIKWSSMK